MRPLTGVRGDWGELAVGREEGREKIGKCIDMMRFLLMMERFFFFCHELFFLIRNHV